MELTGLHGIRQPASRGYGDPCETWDAGSEGYVFEYPPILVAFLSRSRSWESFGFSREVSFSPSKFRNGGRLVIF